MEMASDEMEERESLLNGTDSNTVEIRVDDHGATFAGATESDDASTG